MGYCVCLGLRSASESPCSACLTPYTQTCPACLPVLLCLLYVVLLFRMLGDHKPRAASTREDLVGGASYLFNHLRRFGLQMHVGNGLWPFPHRCVSFVCAERIPGGHLRKGYPSMTFQRS